MRVGVLFSLDHLQKMIKKNIDVILIIPGSDFDEVDIKERVDINCVHLNDFLEEGEMSPLSRFTADYIRSLMNKVKGPSEALASQNDLYQYHLRMQFLFLVALERFLLKVGICELLFSVKPYPKYFSPMRPDLVFLYNEQKLLAYLALNLMDKVLGSKPRNNSSLFHACEILFYWVIIFFRKKIINTFILFKLCKKIILAKKFSDKKGRFFDRDATTEKPKVGIVVRTDSEVISAYSLIKKLESEGVRYVVIQDEILASTTTVVRLRDLGIKYVPVGCRTNFKGLVSTFLIKRDLLCEDDVFVRDHILRGGDSFAEKVMFLDSSISRELKSRLTDFFIPQRHFKNELKNMVEAYNIVNFVTFAYVDQWGGIVQSVADEHGIGVVAIQNAAQDPEEYPRLCWADKYCVESIYLKDRLIALGYPESRIYATGLPHYTSGKNTPELHPESSKKKQIVILTQPIYHQYYIQIIREVANFCARNDLLLAVKYHPRQLGNEYDAVIEGALSAIKVLQREPLDEIIKDSRLVISIASAAILKSLNIGVPTLSFLPKSEKYLDLYYTDSSNLFVVKNLEELKIFLVKSVCGEESKLLSEFEVKLKHYYYKHCVFEGSTNPLDNVFSVISQSLKGESNILD